MLTPRKQPDAQARKSISNTPRSARWLESISATAGIGPAVDVDAGLAQSLVEQSTASCAPKV